MQGVHGSLEVSTSVTMAVSSTFGNILSSYSLKWTRSNSIAAQVSSPPARSWFRIVPALLDGSTWTNWKYHRILLNLVAVESSKLSSICTPVTSLKWSLIPISWQRKGHSLRLSSVSFSPDSMSFHMRQTSQPSVFLFFSIFVFVFEHIH